MYSVFLKKTKLSVSAGIILNIRLSYRLRSLVLLRLWLRLISDELSKTVLCMCYVQLFLCQNL